MDEFSQYKTGGAQGAATGDEFSQYKTPPPPAPAQGLSRMAQGVGEVAGGEGMQAKIQGGADVLTGGLQATATGLETVSRITGLNWLAGKTLQGAGLVITGLEKTGGALGDVISGQKLGTTYESIQKSKEAGIEAAQPIVKGAVEKYQSLPQGFRDIAEPIASIAMNYPMLKGAGSIVKTGVKMAAEAAAKPVSEWALQAARDSLKLRASPANPSIAKKTFAHVEGGETGYLDRLLASEAEAKWGKTGKMESLDTNMDELGMKLDDMLNSPAYKDIKPTSWDMKTRVASNIDKIVIDTNSSRAEVEQAIKSQQLQLNDALKAKPADMTDMAFANQLKRSYATAYKTESSSLQKAVQREFSDAFRGFINENTNGEANTLNNAWQTMMIRKKSLEGGFRTAVNNESKAFFTNVIGIGGATTGLTVAPVTGGALAGYALLRTIKTNPSIQSFIVNRLMNVHNMLKVAEKAGDIAGKGQIIQYLKINPEMEGVVQQAVESGSPSVFVKQAVEDLKKPIPKESVMYKSEQSFNQAGTAGKSIINDLSTEAKKYKNADEFIKKQPVIYHGTPEKFTKFDTNRMEGGTAWFTADKKDILDNTVGAVQSAGQKLNIMERYVKPNVKLATPEMTDKYMTDQLIQQGFKGVKYPKGDYGDYEWTSLWFPNEDTVTKSQLKDIWNKTHGK